MQRHPWAASVVSTPARSHVWCPQLWEWARGPERGTSRGRSQSPPCPCQQGLPSPVLGPHERWIPAWDIKGGRQESQQKRQAGRAPAIAAFRERAADGGTSAASSRRRVCTGRWGSNAHPRIFHRPWIYRQAFSLTSFLFSSSQKNLLIHTTAQLPRALGDKTPYLLSWKNQAFPSLGESK